MKLEAHMSLYQTTGEVDLVGILLDLFIPLPFSPLTSPSPWRINFICTNMNLLFLRIITAKFGSISLNSLAGEY